MNSNHINKVLGIFIGAVIGAIVGHKLIQYGLWLMFVAPITGALITSFMVAPKTTWNIIKIAWKTTCVEMPCGIWAFVNSDRFKKALFRLTILLVGIMLSIILTSISVILLMSFKNTSELLFNISMAIIIFYVALSWSILITGFFDITEDDTYKLHWGGIKLLIKYCNVFAAIFWTSWLIFKGLRYVYNNRKKYLDKIILGFMYTVKFIARFFTHLESGLRTYGLTISVLSAAVGAFIGQFYSQPLYGGLIGVVTYSIMHLSIWIIAVCARALPKRILQ